MLRQNFASVPAVEIKLDLTVRPTRRGGEVAWEKGWSVYTPAGSLARIALRIEEREPLHLQVFLNQRPLLDTVPDWFVQRPSPDRDYELSEAPLMPILIAIHNALSSDQPGF